MGSEFMCEAVETPASIDHVDTYMYAVHSLYIIHEVCHGKTDLKVFVFVIPKEGLAD